METNHGVITIWHANLFENEISQVRLKQAAMSSHQRLPQDLLSPDILLTQLYVFGNDPASLLAT